MLNRQKEKCSYAQFYLTAKILKKEGDVTLIYLYYPPNIVEGTICSLSGYSDFIWQPGINGLENRQFLYSTTQKAPIWSTKNLNLIFVISHAEFLWLTQSSHA